MYDEPRVSLNRRRWLVKTLNDQTDKAGETVEKMNRLAEKNRIDRACFSVVQMVQAATGLVSKMDEMNKDKRAHRSGWFTVLPKRDVFLFIPQKKTKKKKQQKKNKLCGDWRPSKSLTKSLSGGFIQVYFLYFLIS